MSDIQETLDRLRGLDKTTSPAPWTEATDETNPEMPCLLLDSNGGLVAEGEGDWASHWFHIDNMVPLLTELRNALPVLLTEIDRLNNHLSIANARLGRVAASYPEAYEAALEGARG